MEIEELLDRRVQEVYNKPCTSVRISDMKYLYFDMENGFPVFEFELEIERLTWRGPAFQIREFYYADKLKG